LYKCDGKREMDQKKGNAMKVSCKDIKMENPSTRHEYLGLIVGDDMISVDQLNPHFRLEKGGPPNSHDEHGFGDHLFYCLFRRPLQRLVVSTKSCG
jgi:hypothetical protein